MFSYCYVLHVTIEKAVIKTLLVAEVLQTLTKHVDEIPGPCQE